MPFRASPAVHDSSRYDSQEAGCWKLPRRLQCVLQSVARQKQPLTQEAQALAHFRYSRSTPATLKPRRSRANFPGRSPSSMWSSWRVVKSSLRALQAATPLRGIFRAFPLPQVPSNFECLLTSCASDWDCLGRWTLFASPVRDFAFISTTETLHAPPALNGSIAFISANSPVAFVSLFPPRHLFTLPGTRSAVELVALSKTDILVLYKQGLARVCDIASRELRRSMDAKTTESVLAEDAWTTW